MTDVRSGAPRALIVHAHPEPESFTSAQARASEAALFEVGFDVDVIDLYAEAWQPVLSRSEFAGDASYFKPQAEQLRAFTEGSLHDPVANHVRRVQGSELLVLSFPLWWFSMPAILKGWIDRVFVMGAAFGGDHGIFADGGLRGRKAMVLLTTGGSEPDFGPDSPQGYGDLDTFLFHIHHGMLEFCGFEVLPPIVTHAPARLDDDGRRRALARIGAGMRERLSAAGSQRSTTVV